jgi:carbon-monoxide dehydrogenase medium subunit
VKPPAFEYHDPRSLPEALELLASKENSKLLAGGQSLMPMLNMRYVRPDHLIDLNRLDALSYIREEAGAIRIGSMTRQRELEFSELVRRRCPLMHEALRSVGHRQTRNRGTIGGSLCHLDPAAELPSVAMAHEAIVEAEGPRGRREIPMAAFPAFYMTPAIEPDELVAAIRFTPWPEGHGSAFLEFARRQGDFAIVSAAALIELAADRTIRRASLTIGGAAYAPQRIGKAEALLAGAAVSPEALHSAAEACSEIDATADIHASADYRRHLAATLAFRALEEAGRRASRGSAPR